MHSPTGPSGERGMRGETGPMGQDGPIGPRGKYICHSFHGEFTDRYCNLVFAYFTSLKLQIFT